MENNFFGCKNSSFTKKYETTLQDAIKKPKTISMPKKGS